jgi:hypothetical protein
MGKETSLISKDLMKIQGGIKLTEYAPQKRLKKVEEDAYDDLSENPNLMDFEKRTLRRLRDESEGNIQPRIEINKVHG